MIDLLWLALSIAIIILLIVQVKLHPAMSLIIGTVFLGLTLQIPLPELADATAGGFGNLMAGIGLSVGFGIILGQLLSDSGGAKVIARTVVGLTSERFSMYGLAAAAFLLSIPVFYDVTFVILVPLAIPIAREANKPLPLAIGSVALGAGVAHTLVPPTPNPLAAGSIMGFETGTMMIAGSIVGFIALIAAVYVYSWILPKIWKPAADIDKEVAFESEDAEEKNAPGFFLSILPLLVPVILILSGTVWLMFEDEQPAWLQFIGNQHIALLLGALIAYAVAAKALNREERDESANTAVRHAGVVLLITGAGGALGGVIRAGGLEETIASSVDAMGGNYLLALLVCYCVGAAFRVAVGSGTVASITTLTIMASVAPAVGIHPVWVTMACLGGALTLGHINDSGFWVTAKLPGFTLTGGLKTYTLAQSITGFFVLILALVGATIIPMGT
ncbi:GntP family permease [Nesterenkonia ebinurensis]|uniref:GntP family permease n=1 Tax=Nesterenkonia ebinurensis TaxID=2608252 RepID=UPI00123D609C|nr:GntP family permease [Nesterenkonia ebinurensis]